MARQIEGEPQTLDDALWLFERGRLPVRGVRTRAEGVAKLQRQYEGDLRTDGASDSDEDPDDREPVTTPPGPGDQTDEVGEGNPYGASEPMDYDAMSNDERRAELERRGLDDSGNKPELIDRLERADNEELTPEDFVFDDDE